MLDLHTQESLDLVHKDGKLLLPCYDLAADRAWNWLEKWRLYDPSTTLFCRWNFNDQGRFRRQ